MSSRNVAIRKDVYDALVKEKRPLESFTQLFLRLLSEKPPLESAMGAWGKFDRRRASRTLTQLHGGSARSGR